MSDNVNEGTPQTVNDGGNITVWKLVDGVYGWYALPVADVANIAAKADTALQPEQVTPIVTEDPEAYVRVADFANTLADLQATIAFQALQISNLEVLTGAGLISVLEDGILEPGVVV